MSSTSSKNQAPASVAAATSVIARAASNAGLPAIPACDGFAVATVTLISGAWLGERGIARALSCRGKALSLPRGSTGRVDRNLPPAIFRRLRDGGLLADVLKAPVAELVDALDSKSSSARSAGSIPARGTSPNCSVISIVYLISSIPHPSGKFRPCIEEFVSIKSKFEYVCEYKFVLFIVRSHLISGHKCEPHA